VPQFSRNLDVESNFTGARSGDFSMMRFTASPSIDAVIRVYDEAGNVIETQQHAGDFKEW
jgi:hypothetical protein